MSFFEGYTFFLLLAIAIIPAAVLGLNGRRISRYGFAVSVVFLALLFYKTPMQLLYLGIFLAIQLAVVYGMLHLKTAGKTIRKPLLWAFLLASLAPLVIYKIGAVFGQSLLGFLGISYITFKSVQMLLETYDGLIKEMSLFDCLYFLLFFPPFTSGPIDRSRRFVEDANRTYAKDEYIELLSKGLTYLLVGLVYKTVLAAIFYRYYTPAAFVGFGDAQSAWASIWTAFVTSYAYGFYLFFDFAGYSFMAIGASYCFGIKTPKNFHAPFISIDIKDFWNRWHMTLSFWLRDFVFMRFARAAAKHKWFKSRLTSACCGYLVNMTLMGFWHGITPDYICYGIYHGVLLALTDIYQKKSKFYKKHKSSRVFKAVQWFITINLVMLGFSIFSGQLAKFLGR